ncbi:MAG TPA: hypothetical protein VNL17_14355 [Verrucomicrobiae bacterium]|nr:hypothetical protein [Verrucomicrobiae bacterium]
MKPLLVSLLLIVAIRAADVKVLCTPEPLAANLPGMSQLGIWNVMLVNTIPHAVTISPEQVRMAVPQLHMVDPKRVQQIAMRTYNSSKFQRLLRVMGYADLVGPVLVGNGRGLISVSPTGIAITALVSMVLHRTSDNLKAQLPDLAAYESSALTGDITLEAAGTHGASITLTVYAGKMKGAHELTGVVYSETDDGMFPRLPPKLDGAGLLCRSGDCATTMPKSSIREDPKLGAKAEAIPWVTMAEMCGI